MAGSSFLRINSMVHSTGEYLIVMETTRTTSNRTSVGNSVTTEFQSILMKVRCNRTKMEKIEMLGTQQRKSLFRSKSHKTTARGYLCGAFKHLFW